MKAVVSVGENTAVMACVAAVSAVVLNVACPAVTVAGEPRLFAPSLNWTLPAAVGVTVAVKVTFAPAVCGEAGLAAIAVVVGVAAGAEMM